MLYDHRRPDVAVFIDFENVYVSIRDKLDANPNFETIMDRCNDLGRVVISRAYADWYRYPRITSALYANSIEPIYVPTYYYDKDMGRTGRAIKNSVDMNLCIDVMKTLYTNTSIGKFVLATGDRDFIPLVNSIRQQGKEVIVIGVGGAASTHLAQSADEFIFYEQLVGKAVGPARRKAPAARTDTAAVGAAAPKDETTQEPDIYNVLVDAVHLVRERGYVSTLGSLKLVMKELMGGDFKENRYRDLNGRPFNKFKDFVIDAEKRGKVQIFTSGTVNEVFLPGEDPLKLSQFAGDINEAPVQPDIEETVSKNGYQQPEADTAAANNNQTSSTSGRSRRRRRPRKTTSKKDEQVAAEQPEVADTPEEVQEPQEAATAETGEPAPEAGKSDYEAMLPTIEPSPEQESQYEHLLAGLLAETSQTQDDTLFDQVLANAVSGKQDAEWQAEATEAEAGAASEQDAVQELEVAYGDEVSAQPDIGEQAIEEAELAQAEAFTEIEEAAPAEAQEEAVPAEVQEAQDAAPAEAQQAEPPTAPTADDDTAEREALIFTDEEWQAFREMMAEFSKPISFSQIVDSLKGLRNQGIISRTNEQLRTMGKQAIQNGMLNRSGRGSRIYYSLKTEPTDENGDDSG
jgi:uncharacterized protein (TIGR00288 family)